MFADKIDTWPLSRPDLAQLTQQRSRAELLQLVAERFVHRLRCNRQSQSPQERRDAASAQTPDLVSPRTTTMTSRPGREPLAMRQCPAASVEPVFLPLQSGKRFKTLFVFSSSRVRPLA